MLSQPITRYMVNSIEGANYRYISPHAAAVRRWMSIGRTRVRHPVGVLGGTVQVLC
jgi:hypothetical protein